MSRNGRRNNANPAPADTNRRQKANVYIDRKIKNTVNSNSPMGNNSEADNGQYGGEAYPRRSVPDTIIPQDNGKSPERKKKQQKSAYIQQTAGKEFAESREKNEEMYGLNDFDDTDSLFPDTESHASSFAEALKNYYDRHPEETAKEYAEGNSPENSESEDVTDTESSLRLKKAAYIKENIQLDVLKSRYSEEYAEEAAAETADNGGDGHEKAEKDTPAERESHSEEAPNDHRSEKKYFYLKKRPKKLEKVGDDLVKTAEGVSELAGAIKSGDANQVLALPAKHFIKEHVGSTANKSAHGVGVVSSAVKNSDDIGGAAAGIGTALAADAVKSYVIREIKGENHVERKKDSYRREQRKTDSYKDKAKDKAAKKQFADKKEAIKKSKQRKIFLGRNKDKMPVSPKTSLLKKFFAAKSKKTLLMGAAGMIFPIIILLIVLLLAASLFSWLTPFKFSLAGDDSETPETEADTEAAMIDGYTLLVRNDMDVTQAYYYLVYGDWYGGTYSYPAAKDALSFSRFFSEMCAKIISDIQASFADALANAETPEEAAAIGNAMSQAISEALADAEERAEEEYLALIETLEDMLSADEHRQHYEVTNSGGSNGVEDSLEFDGKPIVGTNHFDDVEINSSLSSEELFAMIALYKSMKLAQTGGKNEDGSAYDFNITPDDIMTFIKDTEYLKITTEVTHDNTCAGENCKRRMEGSYEEGYYWEYYCDGDHDNLSGSIAPCPGKDELFTKIIELTDGEENGFTPEECKKIYKEYIKMIKKDLEISESDFRKFGKADPERAKEFYQMLLNQGTIPNNYWEVDTPIDGEDEESEET